jgi:hypothetical protein
MVKMGSFVQKHLLFTCFDIFITDKCQLNVSGYCQNSVWMLVALNNRNANYINNTSVQNIPKVTVSSSSASATLSVE